MLLQSNYDIKSFADAVEEFCDSVDSPVSRETVKMTKRHLWATVSITLSCAASSQAAETAPVARIAKFDGDRAAAISYTFDDGLRDQYTLAVPMLNEVGFKGTFFIIPNSPYL